MVRIDDQELKILTDEELEEARDMAIESDNELVLRIVNDCMIMRQALRRLGATKHKKGCGCRTKHGGYNE